MVYYFRRSSKVTAGGAFGTLFIGALILVFIQYFIRGYTVEIAAYFDLFFVNTLGLGFWSGAFFFFLIIIAILVGGIWFGTKNKKPLLTLAFLCTAFVYFGYSSFAYIPIRATADTDLDNSHPDNAFILYGYLNRIQYGENPLLYGQYFDAKIIDQTEGSTLYRKGKTKYESSGKTQNYVYDHTTIFPRMYSSEGQDPLFYRQWLNMGENDPPTFGDNIKWMFSWQIYQMYVRYFMWNFVGRYSDADGQTDMAGIDGNWTTGIFDGGRHLPKSIVNANTYTPLYALPLIIGLLGCVYHFQRKKRDALIVLLLFFFTGIAIVLYVNQPSIQPRERDYSYVGSFYAFAIWIGLGVIAIAELIQLKLNTKTAAITATGVCLLAAPVLMASKEWGDHDRSTKMTPHDMAYDYLISCPKNAILFTYGDNDTYSLWYDQEVEGIRPDVRIVNLSLFTGDWYIQQMQKKMNNSAPLPITMPYDKYKEGVRDIIYYDDKKLPGYTDLKEVFDFITSDNQAMMEPYQSGQMGNYLPTKSFKLAVNPADVMTNNVITPEQQSQLAPEIDWKYPSNYITKENLAMIDILSHNNWVRPICFTTTIGTENLIGLQQYLYREGFTYRLLPLKVDTANKDQLDKINSLVMYDNMMNKFRYGNFKHAKYLDHESTTMFYPVMVTTFFDLIDGLMKEGHPDLAKKALQKYDEVLPDLYTGLDVVDRKVFLAKTAYELNNIVLGDKFVKGIDDYLTDQLNYDEQLLQNNSSELNQRDVQYSVSFINALQGICADNHRTDLAKKLADQLKDYETKLGPILQQRQQ